jgi:hypothetical protein
MPEKEEKILVPAQKIKDTLKSKKYFLLEVGLKSSQECRLKQQKSSIPNSIRKVFMLKNHPSS